MATQEIADEAINAETLSVRLELAKVRRRRGWKITGAIAAGTLVLLLGGAYLAVDAFDRRAGEAAIERVRKAGDPVTPQELAEFYPSSPEIERATEHWNRAFVDPADWNADVRGVPILGPQTVTPELDERGFYSAAAVAQYRPFLDGSAAAKLREVRLAREAGAVGRFPQSLDETDMEGSTAHYGSLRSLANVLSLRRQVQESEGDFEGSAETLLDLVAVNEALRNEPVGTSFLVRLALLGVASCETIDSLSRCPYDDERLRAIQQAFERQDLHAGLLRAMRGEQALVLQTYDRGVAGDPYLERARKLPFRGADRAKAVEWFQAYLKSAEGGWAEMKLATDDANAAADAIIASALGEYRYAVAAQRMHYPWMMLRQVQRTQTDANVVAAFAACRRYRLANGEWPETLAALVPDYLSEVPIDPYSTQKLVYERSGDAVQFRPLVYVNEFRGMTLPHLDPTGQYVFDAADFETTE